MSARTEAISLNRSMVLEAKDRMSDGGGGFIDTWQPLGMLWVSLTPGRGRLVVDAARETPLTSTQILTRATPPGSPRRPQSGQRLREGQRTFAILGVTEWDSKGMYLQITAEEGRI